MNQASRGSRVVFVGNIPFELSEEQLIEVFKEVGPVASFRLLFDRDTGRPKGYGFCEFLDAETAASAVRNLNDYEIGGRQLRVDYAAMEDNQGRGNHQSNGSSSNYNNQNRHHPLQPPVQSQQMPAQTMPMPMQSLPPQPMTSTANMSSVDEISKVLASMNSQDLFTLMSQMKQLSFERPDFTREFLTSNPQVAYALFQAMVMMNIVDPNIITRIMTAAATVPPVTQPQPVRPPTGINLVPNQASMPTQPEDETEQQKALLMKVLQLSDEQINALPPQTRDQIRQLKTQLTMQQS
ncbi:MAG: RNA recognition domain-containing protein [Benjaminiella poitrasii]|nr:MAG: RNA recognition domain-containing protein [Benjaminiella poitrasii]